MTKNKQISRIINESDLRLEILDFDHFANVLHPMLQGFYLKFKRQKINIMTLEN